MDETGFFNDNSQYIIQQNRNGRYDARRFWYCTLDGERDDETIIENATYTEAAAAVIAFGYEISESLI